MACLLNLRNAVALAVLLVAAVSTHAGTCMPIEEAQKHIGENGCVTGKVLKVAQSKSGTFFLDFCENYRKCPFTVVVFPRDLRDVGDVTKLEGQTIEITGQIKQYGGRTEIILKDSRQLKGEAAKLPPAPKQYDVQNRGGFSASESQGNSKSKKKYD